jgi:ElaB/YqjD/DUF883 family membrane-anchored ribosome-binding protein
MTEAVSSQSSPQAGTERSAGAKAKQLSRTAAERTKELRKAAARQRFLRQKLQELEETEGELGKNQRRREESAHGDGLASLSGLTEANWDEIKDQLDRIHREAERYVKENPTKAVLAAVGVGFVLGLLMKR